MTNPFTSSARRFRVVLLIALGASIAASVVVVIYGVNQLNSYADTVNQEVVAAASSESTLANVRSQVQQLENSQAVVNRAKQIVAESQEYRYQDTIISDIERFARRANINVQSYDFTASADAAAPTAPPTTPPAEPGAQANGAAPLDPAANLGAAALTPTSSLRSMVVNITLESPVNYRDFLNFLNYIEQNLTKMQVASISLSSAESSTAVNTDSLQIEVYVR